MNMMGGPETPKTERKAQRLVDRFEAQRGSLAKKIGKVSDTEGISINQKIQKGRMKLVDRLKMLKTQGPIGEYAEAVIKESMPKTMPTATTPMPSVANSAPMSNLNTPKK